MEHYGSHSAYLAESGELLTDQDDVRERIYAYLDELSPEVRAVCKVNFSYKNVAATSVTYDNWSSKIRVNVQLPIAYRE